MAGEEQILAIVERARRNAAENPDLLAAARTVAEHGLDEYRRAHAALGLAIGDLSGCDDLVYAMEALDVFRTHADDAWASMKLAGFMITQLGEGEND